MRKRAKRLLSLLLITILASYGNVAAGFSLDLDSIAEMGKFARFCVDTYRWGDKTFSSFDSTYVVPTGYKFTVRPLAEYWSDDYEFSSGDDFCLDLTGDNFISAGIKQHYMAVSYGYQFSITKGQDKSKYKNYSLGFSCNMFEAALNYRINNVGATITSIEIEGDKINTDFRFNGLHTHVLTTDLNYYFRHKKYSQAALFGMGKIQKKSSGSPFIGLNYEHHRLALDTTFGGEFPKDEIADDNGYASIKFDNYMATLGYGYNLVLLHGWILGFSEGFSVGATYGHSDGYDRSKRFGFANNLRLGVGCNQPRWFLNLVCGTRLSSYRENDFSMLSNYFTGSLSVGYRFNLW